MENRLDEINNSVKAEVISPLDAIMLMVNLKKETRDYNSTYTLFYKCALKKPNMLIVTDLKNLSVIDGDNN